MFIFRASGFALSTFSDVAVWSPMGRVEQDIHYGTLEAIFVSPANRISYLLSTSFSEAIINMIFFVPAYLIILGMAGVLGNIVVVGTTLLVVLLTMISMMGFGVFFAMLAILVRRASRFSGFAEPYLGTGRNPGTGPRHPVLLAAPGLFRSSARTGRSLYSLCQCLWQE